MMELLSSPTEELKTILNPYLHDKMSYQTIKELLERYGKEDFIKSLLDNKDSKLLILNYFKACYIFNADNGLTYSEGLAPVKIGKGKFAYFNELGEVVFTIECEDAYPFSGDYARVRKHLKTGLVDKKGEFKGHLDLKQLLPIVISILFTVLFGVWFYYSLYKLIF